MFNVCARVDMSRINGFEDIQGYENLNVTHTTPVIGINVSFLVGMELINKCAKFEACSFSHSD